MSSASRVLSSSSSFSLFSSSMSLCYICRRSLTSSAILQRHSYVPPAISSTNPTPLASPIVTPHSRSVASSVNSSSVCLSALSPFSAATATVAAASASASAAAAAASSSAVSPFQNPPPRPFSLWLNNPKSVAIVGAPVVAGQALKGVEKGPEFIRAGGLRDRLEADAWRVLDEGNLDFESIEKQFGHISPEENPQAKRSHLVGAMTRQIYEKCYSHAAKGNLVLTLGGDHSIGIGTIAGAIKARPDSAVIWVDAHGDINTPSTSLSGNIHGMVLAFLMNLENVRSTVKGFDWLHDVPIFNPQRLVYIGLRDLDNAEKVIIRSLGIKAFTMHDIDKHGLAKIMEMALDYTQGRVERPIHFSVDIDSVDPVYAPSTGTRVAGGLLYREAYFMCETVAATGMLSSMDLAEVNPALSASDAESKSTVALAVGLIASALGNTIL